MKSLILTSSLVLLLAAAPAWAQQKSTGHAPSTAQEPMLSQQDRSFIEQAMAGDHAEITMGQLAMKQAASPAVREFGRWMVTDHTLSEDALRHFAQRAGLTEPTAPTPQQQAEVDKLQALKGAAFDQSYVPVQVKDHQTTISAFQQEVQTGQNTVLKALTQHMVPMLEQHLAAAQELAALPEVASGAAGTGSGVPASGSTTPTTSGSRR